MKDYKVNGKVIEMTLESGKVVKCSTDWANKSMKALGTDMEDVLLMWLEDNDYLENEEQEELNSKAKANKVKITATSEKKVVKKTPKERVQKENPTKELIIATIAKALENLDIKDLTIENKAKLITFSLNNEDFKVDLVQKRKKKEEKQKHLLFFYKKHLTKCGNRCKIGATMVELRRIFEKSSLFWKFFSILHLFYIFSIFP